MKKVKNILFKLELKGNGIVNYDHPDQRHIMRKYHKDSMYNNENLIFGKKVFDDEGYKLKISSDCIRHNIFINEIPYQTPDIAQYDKLLKLFVSSPAALLRGYLFPRKDDSGLKRKSPFTITQATQTNNAKVYTETCSTSGVRNETSFYKKESIGDIEYLSKGNIDLKHLQFISTDERFDRQALKSDWATDFLNHINTVYNKDYKFTEGIFTPKGSVLEESSYYENGLLLSESTVIDLVKTLLGNILQFRINKNGSYAEFKSLKIKLVYDCTEDTFGSDRDWVNISSWDDINNLYFPIEDFYTQGDKEVGKKIREEIKMFKDDKAAKKVEEQKAKKSNVKKETKDSDE